jgi:hypothetical protein
MVVSDLIAVLTGLGPELASLTRGEALFQVLPAGEIPVRLPADTVSRIILAVVARMRRCVQDGGWMLAGVDRTCLSPVDAARLGLVAGEFARLRVAAGFQERVRTPPVVRLADATADSVAKGLGGQTLRALLARRQGAVQLEVVPGAGITATVFLRSEEDADGRRTVG